MPKNKSLITCKSCGHEVAKSAKACPQCGAKLQVSNLKLLGILAVIFVAYLIYQTPSDNEQKASEEYDLKLVQSANPSPILPVGELAQIFQLNSKHTDLQRENKERELKGKVVQWRLPVYEVNKQRDGLYRIQTDGSEDTVGTFVFLRARKDTDREHIERLKTGDIISVKGKITGTFLRNLKIEHALLVDF